MDDFKIDNDEWPLKKTREEMTEQERRMCDAATEVATRLLAKEEAAHTSSILKKEEEGEKPAKRMKVMKTKEEVDQIAKAVDKYRTLKNEFNPKYDRGTLKQDYMFRLIFESMRDMVKDDISLSDKYTIFSSVLRTCPAEDTVLPKHIKGTRRVLGSDVDVFNVEIRWKLFDEQVLALAEDGTFDLRGSAVKFLKRLKKDLLIAFKGHDRNGANMTRLEVLQSESRTIYRSNDSFFNDIEWFQRHFTLPKLNPASYYEETRYFFDEILKNDVELAREYAIYELFKDYAGRRSSSYYTSNDDTSKETILRENKNVIVHVLRSAIEEFMKPRLAELYPNEKNVKVEIKFSELFLLDIRKKTPQKRFDERKDLMGRFLVDWLHQQ
jgi:hypothetical protein